MALAARSEDVDESRLTGEASLASPDWGAPPAVSPEGHFSLLASQRWTLRSLGPPHGLIHADALCRRLAARHPENFTAVSPLVPAPMRIHLARVYAFCRVTDDLGDEAGDGAATALATWHAEVDAVLRGGAPPTTALTLAVSVSAGARALSTAPFLDLISANVQDQSVHAYATWQDLHAYCRLSAVPVGRMVLEVVGVRDARALPLSDDVCIGLQLANFAQDVSIDAIKGRTYLIGEEVRALGVRGATRALCDRAEGLLRRGEKLEAMCSGWLRAQLTLYRLGGLAVLAAVRARGYDTTTVRPRLGQAQRVRIACAVAPRLFQSALVDEADRDAARQCRDIARREAANFYWGFIALPRAQREAVHAVYAFARRVDDIADTPAPVGVGVRLEAERERLRAAIGGSGDGDDPVLRMVAVAVRRHAIPAEDLEAIITGVERDRPGVRYATWDELAEYCRLVASSVGRICVRVFGYTDPRALQRADDLGMAMQLTNILRDVREDASLGRVYLPDEELRAAGIDGAALVTDREHLSAIDARAWTVLVHEQAARAHALFESGLQVCSFVPFRAATCVRTMAGIYRSLLTDIEARPLEVLDRRLSLSGSRKLSVLARSLAPVAAAPHGRLGTSGR